MVIETTTNSQRTFDSIATATWSAGTVLSFSSIPQTYTHLRAVIDLRSSSSPNGGVLMQINNSTSLLYVQTGFKLTNYMVQSYVVEKAEASFGYFKPATSIYSTLASVDVIDFTNYSNNAYYKNILWKAGGPSGLGFSSQTYRDYPAITSLQFTHAAFTTGAKVSLYGIKGA